MVANLTDLMFLSKVLPPAYSDLEQTQENINENELFDINDTC